MQTSFSSSAFIELKSLSGSGSGFRECCAGPSMQSPHTVRISSGAAAPPHHSCSHCISSLNFPREFLFCIHLDLSYCSFYHACFPKLSHFLLLAYMRDVGLFLSFEQIEALWSYDLTSVLSYVWKQRDWWVGKC